MLSFANGDPWAWNAQLRAASDSLNVELDELFKRGKEWAETEGIHVAPDAYAAYRRSLDKKPNKGERQEIFIADHMRRFAAHVNNIDVPEDDRTIIPMPTDRTRSATKKSHEVPAAVIERSMPPRYIGRSMGRR